MKKRILFIGHDLKFLKHIVNYFSAKEEYETDTFTYPGHTIRDFKALTRKLFNYDIIFCEWGLGNLSWLSKNKFSDQKIIVRIHLQEFVTPYLSDSNWEHIDKVILVGPHMIDEFAEKFPDQKDKSNLIYNVIDTSSFNLTKTEDSIFNIGMLGVLPRRKAPHLGIDLLVELKKIDPRFKVFIKSKKPEELEWLWKREEERIYYDELNKRVKLLNLEDSFIWDPHGTDVQDWFRKIGFILSPSEFESFHMAIPEGMSSGAIPIIRNWEGADRIYPKKFIFSDIEGAVSLIKKYNDDSLRSKEAQRLKDFAARNFGLPVILTKYDKLIAEVANSIDTKTTSPILRSLYRDLNQEQKQENEALRNQINELSENNILAKTEIDSYREQLKDSETKQKEMQQNLHELKNEFNTQTKKIDTFIGVADELKIQLQESRARENQYAETIKEQREKEKLYSNSIKELTEKENQLNEQIAKLIKDREQQNKTLENIKQENDALIDKLNKSINDLTLTNKTKLIEKDTLITELNRQNSEFNALINQLKQNIDDLREGINSTQANLNEKENLLNYQLLRNKEQQQYITYLEKRFSNKIIGIIRKKIKK
jgi:glycosyltransferase involved in cell wall biosynthesis